jgi:hypothetical protein
LCLRPARSARKTRSPTASQRVARGCGRRRRRRPARCRAVTPYRL